MDAGGTDQSFDDRQEMAETPKKRQRSSVSGSTVQAHVSEPTDTDIFDLVQQGRFNDVSCLSWLTRSFHSQEWETIRKQGSGTPTADEISCLDQQLVQVKRRLWPAATACAEAVGRRINASLQFAAARKECNPLEALGEGRDGGLNRMFMNRSAIKLANVDAMTGFTLLSHCVHNQDPKHAVPAFLFVDLCGAPGGFSEYIIQTFSKRPMHTQAGTRMIACRGYGMSLLGRNEHGNGLQWKLQDTTELLNGCHINYRVCLGQDGTGDIYEWKNVHKLREDIRADLRACGLPHANVGVHLVVADGGFDAQRNSEIQEHISQKLIVCETAAALALLRPGGTFVVKMFGFQTDLIQTAMAELRRTFGEILILKPVSSRPASSERYVVCRQFRGVPADWDARTWTNQLFGGTVNGPSTEPDPMLCTFDRDLLKLNLKACFSILSILKQKADAAKNKMKDRADFVRRPAPAINIAMYARAFGLT